MKRPKNFVKILSTVRNSTWHKHTRRGEWNLYHNDSMMTNRAGCAFCLYPPPPFPPRFHLCFDLDYPSCRCHIHP